MHCILRTRMQFLKLELSALARYTSYACNYDLQFLKAAMLKTLFIIQLALLFSKCFFVTVHTFFLVKYNFLALFIKKHYPANPWNVLNVAQHIMYPLDYSKRHAWSRHGIPWNCSCHRNWRTPSSMEFHGIPWNYSCQRNWRTWSSMEFHGTAGVSPMEFNGTYCLLFNGTIGIINTLSFKLG